MTWSDIGVSVCAFIAFRTNPWRRPSPPLTWHDIEQLRREFAEAAEHLADAPIRGPLARWLVRTCERMQRDIADEGRDE